MIFRMRPRFLKSAVAPFRAVVEFLEQHLHRPGQLTLLRRWQMIDAGFHKQCLPPTTYS